MIWSLSGRADVLALPIANRHYNRQNPLSPQFVPPGRCLVLRADAAVWVTSWPFGEYVRHAWPGIWVNSLFRRESGEQASEMIRQALAVTVWNWPDIPTVQSIVGPVSMVTFIDRNKVRRKRDYGRCYRRAGFEEIGETAGGLLALGIKPEKLPYPGVPLYGSLGFQMSEADEQDYFANLRTTEILNNRS